MVGYAKIISIGEELRKQKKDYISRNDLYRLLRDKTNSHRNQTIRHYAEMLRDEKFIRSIDGNNFKILKE